MTGGHADSRTDHFHGGIDLRTGGVELPVVAPSDGWIERIAVSPTGYGRVLYLKMSNERTAVFGHLSRFVPILEDVLRDSQLTAETYRVDFPCAEGRFAFRRGDTLAYTGKTGRGAPHLHFEIREGVVQVDPLAFFERKDDQPPVIAGLWWTKISDYTPLSNGTRMNLKSVPVLSAEEPVAFFVQTYDPGPWGRHAVPARIRILVGDSVTYESVPTRIGLLGSRDIHYQLVWPVRKRDKLDIRRLFQSPVSINYSEGESLPAGWLADLSGEDVTIEVFDRSGNRSAVVVNVSSGSNPSRPRTVGSGSSKTAGRFALSAEDSAVTYWATLESRGIHEIEVGPDGLGLPGRATLTYSCSQGESPDGLYFYSLSDNGSRSPRGRTDMEGNRIACTVMRSGIYGVAEDHTPPVLWLSSRSGRIYFDLTDEESGIDDRTVKCRIDGKTAIAEYEYEEDGGAVWTPQPLTRTQHQVDFEAADTAGNRKTWSVNLNVK